MYREPAILEEDEELEKPLPTDSTDLIATVAAPLSPLISEGGEEGQQPELMVVAETGEEKGMQETEGEKQEQSLTPPPPKENKVPVPR